MLTEVKNGLRGLSTAPRSAPAAARLSRMLTVPEVAELLTVSPRTVYRMVKLKQLPYLRVAGSGLRFPRKEIEAAVTQRTIKPVQ